MDLAFLNQLRKTDSLSSYADGPTVFDPKLLQFGCTKWMLTLLTLQNGRMNAPGQVKMSSSIPLLSHYHAYILCGESCLAPCH